MPVKKKYKMFKKIHKIYSDILRLLNGELEFEKAFTYIGVGVVSYYMARVCHGLYRMASQNQISLRERYGEGAWAVVTGPTSGLGRAFALELARQGFCLMLIGRNKEKLEKIEDEIYQVNNKSAVMIYEMDFTQIIDFDKCFQLDEALEFVDPAILVNNVGVVSSEEYVNTNPANLKNNFIINCTTMAHLCRIFISKMLYRKKWSAIINVSSLEGAFPFNYIGFYSATKAFVNSFSESLALEYNSKIDVLSFTPFRLSNETIAKKNHMLSTTAEKSVLACLKALGHKSSDEGDWRSSLMKVFKRFSSKKFDNFLSTQKKGNNFEAKRLINESFGRTGKNF